MSPCLKQRDQTLLFTSSAVRSGNIAATRPPTEGAIAASAAHSETASSALTLPEDLSTRTSLAPAPTRPRHGRTVSPLFGRARRLPPRWVLRTRSRSCLPRRSSKNGSSVPPASCLRLPWPLRTQLRDPPRRTPRPSDARDIWAFSFSFPRLCRSVTPQVPVLFARLPRKRRWPPPYSPGYCRPLQARR